MSSQMVIDATQRLLTDEPSRTEADIQADVSLILQAGGLNLSPDDVVRREVQVGDGTRRRIDIQLGHLVIELKKDLNVGKVKSEAEGQLAGYVHSLTQRDDQRYAAILTDGRAWHLYGLTDDGLKQVAALHLTNSVDAAERLIAWLDTVIATRQSIKPIAAEVVARLGATSPSHKLSHLALAELYAENAEHPEVLLKRGLWAKLLRSAFGEAFENDPDLFINHTLLVLTAEAIAHAVIGFDLRDSGTVTPIALARGDLFAEAQVYGVVESDFFDWVLHVPGGPGFVTSIAHRIAQFDWSNVEHDVLKILYESIIDVKVRQSLGEYYTPDWLAEKMVAHAVTDPPSQRVLDPSCGSGTFLFHAVRLFLQSVEDAGRESSQSVTDVTTRVIGIDLHPVAATLARVTYLLAIGRERLTAEDRGPVTIPVYLGDSIQWEQHRDLLSSEDVVVISATGDELVKGGAGTLFDDNPDWGPKLRFPRALLADAHSFDRLVGRLSDAAQNTSTTKSEDLVNPILNAHGVHEDDRPMLRETFRTMRKLHADHRDHIWGYYARNLVRPLWLSSPENRVDVLIGNPPWLRYSKMTPSMQEKYKSLAKSRKLLTGGAGASGRDLSTLFVARSVELYLRDGGTFSFVMPHGIMSRRPHYGFRTGNWSSANVSLTVAFKKSWDLEHVTTGFPLTSCVIHGKPAPHAKTLPREVQLWRGNLPRPDVPWSVAKLRITMTEGNTSTIDVSGPSPSVYSARFRQGAILVPRILLQVDTTPGKANPLGAGAGRVQIVSHQSPQAKDPWKGVSPLSGTVERRFVYPMLMGESIAAFRVVQPATTVLPITNGRILKSAEVAEPEGLSQWWAQVETIWRQHRVASERADLLDRMDYLHQLSKQLPAAPQRVVYTKAGGTLNATRVTDTRAIIDHKLYWAAVSGEAEGKYLVAILNSQVLLQRVRPLQSRGLFGPRDFDKHIFRVPIPVFSRTSPDHAGLAELAGDAEAIASRVDVQGCSSGEARKAVRDSLTKAGISHEIEKLVARILPEID